MKKKFASLSSVAILVLYSLLPAASLLISPQTASAAFAGSGSGTWSDPYLISTCTELQSINSSKKSLYWLAGDINCNSISNFAPIENFIGTLDGRNHTISNLTINRPGEYNTALIKYSSNGNTITNLNITNASITGGGQSAVLIGEAQKNFIRGVRVQGSVTSNSDTAGGLVGQAVGTNPDSMVIDQSGFTGSVTANIYAGGIVGIFSQTGTIQDVQVDADVTAQTAGGVAGWALYNGYCANKIITRAQTTGTLDSTVQAGGIVGLYQDTACGSQTISDSVSLMSMTNTGSKGGIIGTIQNSAVVMSNAYWDDSATPDCVALETYGGSHSGSCSDIGSNAAPGGEPYATGWDFTNVWQQSSGVASLRSSSTLLTGPDVVDGLTAGIGADNSSIAVDWAEPLSHGSYPITGYRWDMKKTSDGWDTLFNSDDTSDSSFEINGLKLGTSYTVRVQAYTKYSVGDWLETTYTTPVPVVHTASTCAELQDFNQQGTARDTYKLANDIDCSGIEYFDKLQWGDGFSGIFDGQGHTISNLNILGVDEYRIGMFKNTGGGAEISNVTFDNAQIVGTEDSSDCGVVAGYMYATDVTNVRVQNSSVTCPNTVGGIAGRITNDGDTHESANVSRVAVIDSDIHAFATDMGGWFNGGSTAGGIFGMAEAGYQSVVSIDQAYSNASVQADRYSAGGIVGYAYASNDADDTENSSTILINNSYSEGTIETANRAGGIIGAGESYNDGYEAVAKIEVSNSYSSASVTGTESSAGGIVGYLDYPDLYEQYVFNNVFAAGAVSSPNQAFALIGSDDGLGDGSLTIHDSYFDQTTTGQTESSAYDADIDGGIAVNTDGNEGNYFKNNTTNSPFSNGNTPVWDFNSTWSVRNGNFPCLQNILRSCGVTVPHVAADLVSVQNSSVVSLEATGCNAVDNFTSQKEVMLPNKDAAYDYPAGLINFQLSSCTPGGTASVALNFMGTYDANKTVVRKYNAVTGIFTTLSNSYKDMAVVATTVEGQPAYRIVYTIRDGGELDQDGLANGTIVDPIGIAQLVVGVPNTGISR
ncbi:MAG: fibronectin type III domain-containing protein [Candidatus Saccharibacteria bacterium]